jgi:dimeric dUTPase (all-alpha-NTP-PPase superfamily)
MKQLQKLFSLQKELDKHILDKHELIQEDLVEKKILALLVELGELANETRSFKFWSLKPSSDRQVILEEYVDGLHFILSLGLELNFQAEVELTSVTPADLLTTQFHIVYEQIVAFRKNMDVNCYNALFSQFLALGDRLSFSSAEIEEAYFKKNDKNFKRQEEGY